MAKKLVAVFVMCIVVLAAVNVHEVVADEGVYKSCYEACHKECSAEGNGYTFCEMKCDADCAAKELEAKLEKLTA